MNYSRESSALAYLVSKESKIVPTQFERLAAAVKRDIKLGKVNGLEFPVEEPPVLGIAKGMIKRKFTEAQKLRAVERVNELREGGMNCKSALIEVGIHNPSYRKWAKQFNISIVGLRPTDRIHDDAIVSLMRDGHSLTSACGTFGACRVSFRARMKKREELKGNQ